MLSSWFGLVLVLVAAIEYGLRLAFRRAPRSTRGYDGLVLFGMLVCGTASTFHHAPVGRFFTALALGAAWFTLTRTELRFRGVPRAAHAGGPVKVGDPMPPFQARTSAGEPFSAKDLIARAPALIVLYRGAWCPFCRSQLAELEREHDRFRAAGLSLFAISTETPEEIAPLEKRLGGRVTFLSDPDGTILDALGRRHRHGVVWYDRVFLRARQDDVALPTTLRVDRAGHVTFFHRARTIDDRPSLAQVLSGS